MQDKLPQFQPDYLISWDFSDKDLPCVVVSRLRLDDGATVVSDLIGRSHVSAGCISLRQVLEEYEDRQREEEKRAQKLRDCMREAGEAFAKAAASTEKVTAAIKDAAKE